MSEVLSYPVVVGFPWHQMWSAGGEMVMAPRSTYSKNNFPILDRYQFYQKIATDVTIRPAENDENDEK